MDQTLFSDGLRLYDQARFQEAADIFRSMLQIETDPDARIALIGKLANCFIATRDFHIADVYLSQAEGEDGGPAFHLMTSVYRAMFLERSGRPDDALLHISGALKRAEKATDISPEFAEAQALLHLTSAIIMVRLEMYEKALPTLLSLAESSLLTDEKSKIYCNLAECYSRLHRHHFARDNWIIALDLGVDREWEAVAHYELGCSLFQLSELAEAKRHLVVCEKLLHEGYPGPPLTCVYSMLSQTCYRRWNWIGSLKYSLLGMQCDKEEANASGAARHRRRSPNARK